MSVHLVAAAAENEVIGASGGLPWRLPADLRRFSALTRGQVVVMGRLTHDSIVARLGHPLPGRTCVVITRDPDSLPPTVHGSSTPDEAARLAQTLSGDLGSTDWFVIGGGQIYRALLPVVDVVDLTRVHARIEGDTRMPDDWLRPFDLVAQEPGPEADSGLSYSFQTFRRREDATRDRGPRRGQDGS